MIKTKNILCFFLLINTINIFYGCSQKPTTVSPLKNQVAQITDINYKPSWLLIGGIDIKNHIADHTYEMNSIGNLLSIKLPRPGDTVKFDLKEGAVPSPGDVIRTSHLKGISDYEIVGDPEIIITLCFDRTIIYWGGKGEIINIKTKERIALPGSIGQAAALPNVKPKAPLGPTPRRPVGPPPQRTVPPPPQRPLPPSTSN